MSYMALYRKWRPDVFEEVKGQEPIITTLKNQITHDRVGHAYLFCGTRGTGKTTVAKLFAKAVNCEHPMPDGSPCNNCATCQAIRAGSSFNVIEIDAASNNGVDNIRDIREEVKFSPATGKYKVYIIDEVHMLSIGAFNALLKTLEEPPSYVIFILATTEAHKIPITILSRCQRYDFHRIRQDTIYDRLQELLSREGVEAEEKAIRYIARAADGSMRDALSLTDQCIAFYLGQTLTYEKVLEVLGAVDMDVYHRLLTCVTGGDTMGALQVVDEIVRQGSELAQFVTDFTWYLRNLMLVKLSDAVEDQLDLSAENLEIMRNLSERITLPALMRDIRVFSELSNTMRYAAQKRVALEIAVIKLTTPQMETDMDSVLERIRILEQKVEDGGGVIVQQGDGHLQEPKKEEEPDREEMIRSVLTPAEYADMQQIMDCIREIQKNPELCARIGQGTMGMMNKASVNIGSDRRSIVLSFDGSSEGQIAYRQFSKEEPRAALKALVGERTGKTVEITCRARDTLEEKDAESVDISKINFPVTEE